MHLATRNNERFVVNRRGEPSVVIMSAQDFVHTIAPPPDWLKNAWAGAKRRGLDALPVDEANAETEAYRREKKAAASEVK